MIVELFGSGCAKCRALEDALRQALDELGMSEDATIYRIQDPASIVGRGVWRVPGLALDGKVVLRGTAPMTAEVKELLAAASERAGG